MFHWYYVCYNFLPSFMEYYSLHIADMSGIVHKKLYAPRGRGRGVGGGV